MKLWRSCQWSCQIDYYFGAKSVDILLKTAMISGLLAYLVMFIWFCVTSMIACMKRTIESFHVLEWWTCADA